MLYQSQYGIDDPGLMNISPKILGLVKCSRFTALYLGKCGPIGTGGVLILNSFLQL